MPGPQGPPEGRASLSGGCQVKTSQEYIRDIRDLEERQREAQRTTRYAQECVSACIAVEHDVERRLVKAKNAYLEAQHLGGCIARAMAS